jgi:hypothetical protein
VLQLIIGQLGENLLDPARKLDFDLQSRRVVRVPVGISEAGEKLMLHVPRRPETVQIEASRPDHAVAQVDESLLSIDALAVKQGADISVALCVLNLFQLIHDVVGALFESGVAGGCPHQTDRREVMPCDMSGQVSSRTIPSAIAFCFGLESGTLAKEGEDAIGFELQQIFGVGVLSRFERTSSQPDMVQRYGVQLDRLVTFQFRGSFSFRRGLSR